MWLAIKCLLFGIFNFFAMQGFLDVFGLARSIPANGAIVMGILSIPNYVMMERFYKSRNDTTENTGPR